MTPDPDASSFAEAPGTLAPGRRPRPDRPSAIDLAGSVYGLPRWLAWTIALYPVVTTLALSVLLWIPRTKPHTRRLFLEDRLIENLTAAAYLVAAILGVVLLWRLLRRAPRQQLVIVAFLALLCLFVGGEEISWGTRIFHWKTVPLMRAINSQKENTLHNIRGFQPFNDWLPFTLAAIGLVEVLGHTRNVRDASGVPSILLPFFIVVVVLAGYDRVTDTFSLSIYYPIDLISGRMGEYMEALVALSFALGFGLALRRDVRQRADPEPRGP